VLLPANAVEDEATADVESYVRVVLVESTGGLEVSCCLVLVVLVPYAATDDKASWLDPATLLLLLSCEELADWLGPLEDVCGEEPLA